MPYIPNMTDDQSKNPAQGTVAPGAVSGTPTGAPSGVGGGAASPGATSAPQQQPGGSFATLQTYLNANQGQAPGLTDKITSGINQQYNTLQGQNQQVLQGIQGQVGQGYTAQNNDILAQEAANPVSFASNPGNIKSFQGQLNDKYTGPTSAESTGAYSNQLANVNNAISTGQNQTGTEAGRQQLLTQNEARPTTGVTALNSAILTQDPNSLSKVQNAYQPFNNLVSGLTSGASDINKQIGSATTEAQSASDKANQQIASQVQGLNTNVGNELNTAQKQYQDYTNQANQLGSALQSGNLANAPGVDPGLQAFITGNINPWIQQYLPNQTPTYNYANAIPQMPSISAPTLSNVVTPQDFATYNALNQISGTTQASALQGLPPGSPFVAPSLPAVNNQAIAGDIYNGLQDVQGNVAQGPYQQYVNLLLALDKYQGKTTDANFNGPWPTSGIPTIA